MTQDTSQKRCCPLAQLNPLLGGGAPERPTSINLTCLYLPCFCSDFTRLRQDNVFRCAQYNFKHFLVFFQAILLNGAIPSFYGNTRNM